MVSNNTQFVYNQSQQNFTGVPVSSTQINSISSDVASAASGIPMWGGFELLGKINTYTQDIYDKSKIVDGVADFNVTAKAANLSADELAAQSSKKGGIFKFLRHPIKTAQSMFSGAKAYTAEAKGLIGKGSFNFNNGNLFNAIKKIDETALSAGSEQAKLLNAQRDKLVGLMGSTDKKVVKEAIGTANEACTNASKAAKAVAKTAGEEGAKKGIFGTIKSSISGVFKKATAEIGKTAVGKSIQNGLTRLGNTAVGKFAKTALSKVKGTGAGFMAAIDGAMQMFTEVIPAFKNGGIGAGFKQLGKSAVNVLGSTGGWVAGAAVGTKVGAAIGSIFPGVGTLIGGALGFVGGTLGSALFSGIAKKITGKSENEKIQEQQEALAQGGTSTDGSSQASFGNLTNTNSSSQGISIATNPDGSFDYSVPTSAYPQIAGMTNPYGLNQMA